MIEQKFKPNATILNLKDVSMDIEGRTPEDARQKANAASTRPIVYYYGVQMPAEYITEIIINDTGFIPTFSLVFKDLQSIISDIGFPSDNAIITIIFPTNHKLLKNITMDFKIEYFHIELLRDGITKEITMKGICNINKLLISEYLAFKDSSSYDVFKKIAEQSGLGLMSNCSASVDKMTWVNFGWKNVDFLQYLVNKGWVGESGFLWGFVDLYYNLNYIDLEKSLSQDINEIKWIPSDASVSQNNNSTLDIEPIIPMLSNLDNVKGSNLYFSTEKIVNQSTKTSIDRGYLRKIHYYDVDGNWADKAGSYKKYVLDTITTPGSEKTSVYLKGDPGDTTFYKANDSNHYMDKLDTKNMHPDFLWASKQNEENIEDLQKVNMQIILPMPNYNIRRFEKVTLLFANNTPSFGGEAKVKKLNGEWLVTGSYLQWNGEAMFQYINIVKRELNYADL